jgi:hypothetical protein
MRRGAAESIKNLGENVLPLRPSRTLLEELRRSHVPAA